MKRDIRTDHAEHGIPVGAKRNFVALMCGVVAPPFLGLLACYDTRRALNTHRAAVVIFFTLTIVCVPSVYGVALHTVALRTP